MTRTSNGEPLVSIITVVLNRVNLLRPCIESVLSQSHRRVEHVIVDGGSTDGTVELLTEYNKKYPERVRFISEPDDGPDYAANKCIAMSKGDILGLLGSDDLLLPGVIEKAVNFFRENPQSYFVYGDCNFIDDDGTVLRTYRPGRFNHKRLINDIMDIFLTSAYFRREIFTQTGPYFIYPEAIGVSDYDFLIRVSNNYPIDYIPEVLSSYRLRPVILTGTLWERENKIYKACYAISRHHGGSRFSGHFVRYYSWLAVCWMRSLFNPIYPFLEKLATKYKYRKN